MTYGSTVLDRLDEAFIKIMIEELAQSTPQSQAGIPKESAEGLAADESDTAVALPSLPDVKTPDTSADVETIPLEPSPLEPASVKPPLVEPPSVEPSSPAVSEITPAAPVPGKPMRWQLRVVCTDKPECVLPLEDKPVTIGRGRENAIVLNCHRVSREHARIRLDENRPRVDDLDSRNGILVNGVKVPAAYLRPNDEVLIGSVRIYVEAAE